MEYDDIKVRGSKITVSFQKDAPVLAQGHTSQFEIAYLTNQVFSVLSLSHEYADLVAIF